MRQRITKTSRPERAQRIERAAASVLPAVVSPLPLLHLQRSAGNQAVGGLLQALGAQAKLTVSQPGDHYEQEADRTAEQVMTAPLDVALCPRAMPLSLQRRCAACAAGGSCPKCEEEEKSRIHRKAAEEVGPTRESNPDHFLDNLGPGQPIAQTLRAFFEPRFGHDFSRVRLHTGARAAESARAINALAYTVGPNIVFAPGRFAPQAASGLQLLAHELTHTIQRSAGSTSGPIVSSVGTIQRAEDKNPLDKKAKAIIAKAKDESIKPEVRAVEVVKMIIDTYFSADKALADSVVYDNDAAGTGLDTLEVMAPGGDKSKSKGKIRVGDYFLKGTNETQFARRVLQVEHELEHIKQWRSGLAGGHKKHEREFLACHLEGLAKEKPGTGRVSHATRVVLIDGALGHYYCLSEELQKKHKEKKKDLLERRAVEAKVSGKGESAPPTDCKKK